jgi:hypothetical protein
MCSKLSCEINVCSKIQYFQYLNINKQEKGVNKEKKIEDFQLSKIKIVFEDLL